MNKSKLHDVRKSYLDMVRQNIHRRGYALHLFAGDKRTPPYGYTVGLSQSGRAELLIIGSSARWITMVLNKLAADADVDRMPRGEAHNVSIGKIDTQLVLQELDRSSAWKVMLVSQEILPQPPSDVLQVVWSTTGGLFPGDPGYPENHSSIYTQSIECLQASLVSAAGGA